LIFAFDNIAVELKRKFRHFSMAMFMGTLLTGCLGTRYLLPNEKLLYRQRIKAPQTINTEPLQELYEKKVNRKLLGLPINTLVWMHHEGLVRFENPKSPFGKQHFVNRKQKLEKTFDRKIAAVDDPRKRSSLQFRRQRKIDRLNLKIENGNLWMQWGEPAAVFDTASVNLTIEKLNTYLFNKGYFRARSSATFTEFKRRVAVTYNIAPGPAYVYDTLIYAIADSTVHQFVIKSLGKSYLKKGDAYDQDKLAKERERLDLLLRDNGYYEFSRQYIDFDIDTTYARPHKIAAQIKIAGPARGGRHRQFVVDSVSLTPDAGLQTGTPGKRITRQYHNITFNYFNDYYSERILSQRVFIAKDSLYSRSKTFATQQQLANLDMFKFVNINYDTAGGKFTANIFSSPLDRYSWSNEGGLSLTQGFPGPYYSLGFKKRNIFRGLETFELSGRFGFEGVASFAQDQNIYRSTEANVNATITFPQFILPLKKNSSFRLGKYNPRTRLLAGYTYSNRPEYTRAITTLSNTYNWDDKRTTLYSFTLTNLNIIQSTVQSQFDSLLISLQETQGNNLRNSFRPSFVSSMIFSIIWNPNNYGSNETSAFFLRTQVESGGTLFNFYNPQPISERGLELYRFVRASLDVRRTQTISKNSVVAARLNGGVAYAYSDNRTLPYEKFFFAGGSNSVRAWRPRRLGIGSYPVQLSANPEADGLFDYRFERPGDILLEGSLEFRTKLFGFVNGAWFIDAGNVWSFRELSPATPGSTVAPWVGSTKFKPDQFFREFGVGTGLGLRFDFTFLVLRFDAGIKVYDPSRAEGDRFVLDKLRFIRPFGAGKEPVIYNIGIGYPF